LSQGFPIERKASSVFYYNTDLAKLGADIYMGVPFAAEMRCLLDFVMSKTSLDMFQFFQLLMYHYQFYANMNGNRYYGEKVLGSRTTKCEKCLSGTIVSFVLLTILIGPFFFFSEYSPVIGFNPLITGDIDVNL